MEPGSQCELNGLMLVYHLLYTTDILHLVLIWSMAASCAHLITSLLGEIKLMQSNPTALK